VIVLLGQAKDMNRILRPWFGLGQYVCVLPTRIIFYTVYPRLELIELSRVHFGYSLTIFSSA